MALYLHEDGAKSYIIGHVSPGHDSYLEETHRHRTFYMAQHEFIFAVGESAPFWHEGNRSLHPGILAAFEKVQLLDKPRRGDQENLKKHIPIELTDNFRLESVRALEEGCHIRYSGCGIDIQIPMTTFESRARAHLQEEPVLPLYDLKPGVAKMVRENWAILLAQARTLVRT